MVASMSVPSAAIALQRSWFTVTQPICLTLLWGWLTVAQPGLDGKQNVWCVLSSVLQQYTRHSLLKATLIWSLVIKIGPCGQWAIFKYRSTTSSLFQSRCLCVHPPSSTDTDSTVLLLCSRRHEWTERLGWGGGGSGGVGGGAGGGVWIKYHTAWTASMWLLYEWTWQAADMIGCKGVTSDDCRAGTLESFSPSLSPLSLLVTTS